jgi:tryptophan synthase alpha chain
MNVIAQTLARCADNKRTALIPFLTAGYPDERTFLRLLEDFGDAGADLVEIGIPFSDPLADGPVIQQASQHALEHGMTVARTLRLLKSFNGTYPAPRILMSYFNPLRAYGLQRFADHAQSAGISGLIVPDLIWEEGAEVERVCRDSGIDLIYLLARTSSPQRRRQIIRKSRGFVYLVSVTGVTGAKTSFPPSILNWIRRIKQESTLPVCVGFGITTPAQAQQVSRAADGVIVGSAIIDLICRTGDPGRAIGRVRDFLRRIRKGIDHD